MGMGTSGMSAAVRAASQRSRQIVPRTIFVRPKPTQDLVVGFLPTAIIRELGVSTESCIVAALWKTVERKLRRRAGSEEAQRRLLEYLRRVVEAPELIGRKRHLEHPHIARRLDGRYWLLGLVFETAIESKIGRDSWWVATVYRPKDKEINRLIRRGELQPAPGTQTTAD
jgi:hypothetical protein